MKVIFPFIFSPRARLATAIAPLSIADSVGRRKALSPKFSSPKSRSLKFRPLILLLLLTGLLLSGCLPGDQRLGSSKFGWSPVSVAPGSAVGSAPTVYTAARLSGNLDDLGDREGRDLDEDENKVKLQALQDNGDSIPNVLWTFPRMGSGEGVEGIFHAPIISEELGLIFFSAVDGTLYALDRELGVIDGGWSRSAVSETSDEDRMGLVSGPALGHFIDETGQPVTAVVVGSEDGRLYGFNAATGAPLWEPFATGGKIWSTPTIQDNSGNDQQDSLVFFGSHDQNIYAVNLRTGKQEWQFATGGTVVAQPLLFQASPGNSAEDKIIVGSFDRTIYALNARTGQLDWEFQGSNWFWAGAVARDKIIYAATMDGDIYALDESGALDWQYQVQGAVAATPALVPDRLVVADVDGRLTVLDIGVIGAGASRFLSDQSFDPDNFKAPLFVLPGSSELEDAVFLGSEDGLVRRIKVRDTHSEQWCFDVRKNARCDN